MKKIVVQFQKIVLWLFIFLLWESDTYTQNSNVLYGITTYGGNNDVGVLFHLDGTTGIQEMDYTFYKTIGVWPIGDLREGNNGKYYGMTEDGGENGDGVIFEWDPATNIYIKKIDFDRTDKGNSPGGSLTLYNGKFYGTTCYGGANDMGVVFEWDPVTNNYNKKIDFDGAAKGNYPFGSLTYSNGKFYGMTSEGGSNDKGIIFEWDPVNNDFTKKIDFDGPVKGSHPYGSLVLYSGKLYGMTHGGGSNNMGVIFEWDPVNNNFNNKINFNGTDKGSNPLYGSLTLNAGKFYGMTSYGGSDNMGVIFEWDPATNIYAKKTDFDGALKGRFACGSLTLTNGNFYGMTREGGENDMGVIFKWNPITNIFSKKIDFGFDSPLGGEFPYGSLTPYAGKFIGMTNQGGYDNYGPGAGTIFEWDPSTDIFIKKISFNYSESGYYPKYSLSLNGGKFYGVTGSGFGGDKKPVIFEWDPGTTTYNKKGDFGGNYGREPSGALTLHNGKFYGMTLEGGTNFMGELFEWDPFTNIYIKRVDFNGDGKWPNGSLVIHEGKFYGMTQGGGAYDKGVIFEWDPTTNIYIKKIDFDGAAKGMYPYGSLTLSNGKFYGMTSKGGAYGMGVVFEWDPETNNYTKKVDFNGTEKGKYPFGSLALKGAKLYGMTLTGGVNDLGVIFELEPVANTYIKKIDFDGSISGSYPYGSLTLSEGQFYGMTMGGGINDMGVVFKFNPVTNAFSKLLDFNKTNGRWPYYCDFTVYASPTIQASSLTFSNVQTDQMTINWTIGNGEKRVVFLKQSNEGTAYTFDNQDYNPSPVFGNGTQLGTTGWFCVYNATGSGVTVSGLQSGTDYIAHVIEYNGLPGEEKYQTATSPGNPATQTTSYLTMTWTGTISNDWNTSGNWNLNLVPTKGYNIIIPSGTPFQPFIQAPPETPAVCNDIDVFTGTSLTIEPGKVLQVNGSISIKP